MAMTTEQVRTLITLAAQHASYLYGYDEEETQAQVDLVGADFDQWLHRIENGKDCTDMHGQTHRLTVGDKIRLVGNSWDGIDPDHPEIVKGAVVTVTYIDGDNDPYFCFSNHYANNHSDYQGWEPAGPDEEALEFTRRD